MRATSRMSVNLVSSRYLHTFSIQTETTGASTSFPVPMPPQARARGAPSDIL